MEFFESGMNFSFPDENAFHIELCPTYKSMYSGTKVCECIVKHPIKNKLYFIEAKSSFPNPSKNNGLSFNENVNKIIQKFIDSLTLYFGILLNRPFKIQTPLPNNLSLSYFTSLQYSITPILIISDFEESWLPPVKDALNNSLRKQSFIKYIVVEDILVLNMKMAEELKFVQSHS